MNNVDQLDEKYYEAQKNDFDTDDELNEAKKKILTTNSLNQELKKMKSQN